MAAPFLVRLRGVMKPLIFLCIVFALGDLSAQQVAWQPSPGHTQIPIWPGAVPDPQPVAGDLWLDLETLCLRPHGMRPFAAAQLATRLAPYRVEAICGPLVEGAFIALLAASELDCTFIYAERFAAPDRETLRETLYPVEYHVPTTLQPAVCGKRTPSSMM